MAIKIVKVLKWPLTKVSSFTKGISSTKKIGKAANSRFEHMTKMFGATTGAAGVGKGTVDALEALACQDGVCFVVSCVGTAADSVQICASFVPGPNMAAIATMPISWGCKTFVWCCKRSKIPWAGC